MKKTLIALLFISTLSCVSKKAIKKEVLSITEIGYGLSSAKILSEKELKNSPSGKHLTTDYILNIIEKTDSIKTIDKAQFGVEYIVNSSVKKNVEITIVWKYPKGMKNIYGKEISETIYPIEKLTNEYTYSNFTLEKLECIKGIWIFEIYHKSNKLYSKKFYLI
jgi:hypothetical protein